MSLPFTALQTAIYGTLSGAAAVTSALGGSSRIYDRVTKGAAFPYITIGDCQIVDDSNSCDHNSVEAFADIHIWSRAVGRTEQGDIASAVHDALNTTITVSGHSVTIGRLVDARVLEDPDGLTTHGVLTFRYLLHPTS